MPPHWNAWTHLQEVRFDYEKASKPRQVRLSGPSIVVGQPVRIGVSGVEVEAIIAGVDAGVLTVEVKRTTAKVEPPKATQRQQKITAKKRTG